MIWGVKNMLSPDQGLLPSNKKFGRLFAVIFSIVAVYAKWKNAELLATLAIFLAVLLAILSITASHLLAPLNKFWYQLGILQGKVMNPIVLGVIFYLLITPVSFATRLFGRDVLSIRKRVVSSYWVERIPIGPGPDSFKRQF